MSDYRPLMRKLPALLVPLALMVPAVGVISSRSGDHRHVHRSSAAIVTVRDTSLGRRIPAGFLGLSLELSAVTRYAGTDPQALNPVFLQLIRNLTPGQTPVLRIGGKTTDSAWWPTPGLRRPRGTRTILTPRWLAVTGALARSLNARLIVGIGLKANNQAEARAEARAFQGGFGSHIEALGLGNGPKLYQDVNSFIGRYSRLAHTVPGPLAGPDTAVHVSAGQLNRFLAGEPRVSLATVHHYPLQCGASKGSLQSPTIPHLLAAGASRVLASAVAGSVRVAHEHHVPLRIDEMNTLPCDGAHGVGKAFASALWALNTLFALARVGVDGINIHTYPGAPGGLFRFRRTRNGWKAAVSPEYYGLMMFAQAVPVGSRLIATSTRNGAGIQAWATRGTDGHARIVLTNEGSRARKVTVRAGGVYATLERLVASSLRAQRRVRLGGRGFGADNSTGHLTGRSGITRMRPHHASYVFTLPAGSAALLNVSNSRTGTPSPSGGGSSTPTNPGGGASGTGTGGSSQTHCMSQLQPGGIYPVWPSVANCGYPTPTSLDPNGMRSGGTAGVPDGTVLQNASTCTSCLPPGVSWSSNGYLWVGRSVTLSNLYIPGGLVLANSGISATLQNSEVVVPSPGKGSTGYDVNGQGGNVTLIHDWIHTPYNGTTCSQQTDGGNIAIGNTYNITVDHSDLDCFGVVIGAWGGTNSANSLLKVTNSVLISEGIVIPANHNELLYVWPDAPADIENNTLVNPQNGTTELFGDNTSGPLTNITVKDNLLAGNQNNGALDLGCTAGNGYQADMGHYPNTGIVVSGNRFTNIYNVNPPGGAFTPGGTDGGPGTTWTGNYMDNNLATVDQPAGAC